MRRKSNRKGFTIMEMLLVVGITTVLAGAAFSGVLSYLRSMAKLEYDGYAREIFIAAQNHLTMAKSQNYLGRSEYGREDPYVEGAYFFVASGIHEQVFDRDSVLSLMLPVASVDDTLRLGTSYIVRYHKELGQVMDVFCWSESAGRYPYRQAADYAGFLTYKDDRDVMMRYGEEKSVIGYYGGAEAASLARGEELDAPSVTVVNAETLYVIVQNPNHSIKNAEAKLIVTGETSGNVWQCELAGNEFEDRYTVVLDDITNASLQFTERTGSDQLIPGENISIRAVAFNNTALTNVAYSAECVTNSLFAAGSSEDTAKIAYFRHLENLDAIRSGVPYLGTSGIAISKAEQLNDLIWSENCFADADDPYFAFRPVNIGKGGDQLEYNGMGHSIDGLVVSSTENAGVFGTFQGAVISNLKLIDLSVSGVTAGALAGYAESAAIENVLAFNSDARLGATVVGSGGAGGLLGRATSCLVERCAAALVVSSSGGEAGGLIGTADGDTEIRACYSGGHTVNGAYSADEYNVTGATAAGGLVGSLTGGGAEQSYSTCSVRGGYAGGFVGKGAGSFSDCYAAGLVSGAPEREGAFAGSLSGTAEDCLYFSIINERDDALGAEGGVGFTCLDAVGEGGGSGIAALDADAVSYDRFVGASDTWARAVTYDAALSLYYKNTYNLQTVSKLGASIADTDYVAAHYGDWPAPEAFAVNLPSAG